MPNSKPILVGLELSDSNMESLIRKDFSSPKFMAPPNGTILSLALIRAPYFGQDTEMTGISRILVNTLGNVLLKWAEATQNLHLCLVNLASQFRMESINKVSETVGSWHQQRL